MSGGKPSPRILVVEDDRTTADLVALYLRHAGYQVFVEHSGDRALRRLDTERFALLILDVMLPGADGLEICRRARAGSVAGPGRGRPHGSPGVIFLSARTREDERIEGLDLGADDYVTKPFSPRELVARVRAVLRRGTSSEENVLCRGALVLDRARRSVTVDGRAVELTNTEFELLEELARRPGHVKSRRQLLDALSGTGPDTRERTVDVHIRNLRRKLEAGCQHPGFIKTVVGAGYRFTNDQEAG